MNVEPAFGNALYDDGPSLDEVGYNVTLVGLADATLSNCVRIGYQQ